MSDRPERTRKDEVQEYLRKTAPVKEYGVRPRIFCKDGFNVSVQAGYGMYSEPRAVSNFYLMVELGFPSSEIPELNEYAEDKDNHKTTVFGYVPIDLVEDLIAKHGGIA